VIKLFGIVPVIVLAGCAHVEPKATIAAGGSEGADAYVELFGACPAVVTHFKDGAIDVQFWDGTKWVGIEWPSADAPSGCKDLKH
jgi:hypothetical protein